MRNLQGLQVSSVIASTLINFPHIVADFWPYEWSIYRYYLNEEEKLYPKANWIRTEQSNTFLTWNDAWISTLYSLQTFASFSVPVYQIYICSYKIDPRHLKEILISCKGL